VTAPDPIRQAVAARRAAKLAGLQPPPPEPAEEDTDKSPQVAAGNETGKLPTPRTRRQQLAERLQTLLGIPERNESD
jgi:hypothetical protein